MVFQDVSGALQRRFGGFPKGFRVVPGSFIGVPRASGAFQECFEECSRDVQQVSGVFQSISGALQMVFKRFQRCYMAFQRCSRGFGGVTRHIREFQGVSDNFRGLKGVSGRNRSVPGDLMDVPKDFKRCLRRSGMLVSRYPVQMF